ncbi:MAG: hypothetical protein UX31_C0001G0019 [Candidatus Nomurabacteria bacterium GW2011_GWA1_46_11]|uniref:Uncharacterized protein n=2 Tax=Parcubacteria group TaxID=1794811 RepID=A0A1F8EYW3_9BACT|nr:MAG: hypothetical protein UX31_C0001G0019 [Candidatus Nomurabacteria bacterium GW2011_GWA1_46_11]OGN06051.1 MAG: hypothetical protein A2669_00780 [Candidatus Yanofskybacteria bacterium RIFCSPHIGHO2_01_FULL_48_25b]
MEKDNLKLKFCPICAIVSGAWLILSAGMAWEYLEARVFLTPTALFMGGTVVGIADQAEKRFRRVGKNPLAWKSTLISAGMILVYIAVSNLSKFTVMVEFTALLVTAAFLFSGRSQRQDMGERVRDIEEKMKQCC